MHDLLKLNEGRREGNLPRLELSNALRCNLPPDLFLKMIFNDSMPNTSETYVNPIVLAKYTARHMFGVLKVSFGKCPSILRAGLNRNQEMKNIKIDDPGATPGRQHKSCPDSYAASQAWHSSAVLGTHSAYVNIKGVMAEGRLL
jgi:hypothetical protein